MLGFLLAMWRAARNASRYRLKPEDVWDVGLWGLLGGVVGARLVYVLLNAAYYRTHPAEVFFIWTGGMTFYGGLAGGILAGVLVCCARGMRTADMADLAAVSFPIGYALGRVGCFLNGCCYGAVCDLPWATRFHTAEGLTPPSHPAQLYSASAALLMFLVLAAMERRGYGRERVPGQLMVAFVFFYAVYRFFIEFVREGVTAQTTSLLGLTQGQVASLLLAASAAAVWVVRSRAARRREPRSGAGEGAAPRSDAAAAAPSPLA